MSVREYALLFQFNKSYFDACEPRALKVTAMIDNSACSGIRRQQKYRAEHGRVYAAEYDKRARRKYGPNVKVQRRSRKTKKQSSAPRKRDKGGTK